jgi:hypothetical protein
MLGMTGCITITGHPLFFPTLAERQRIRGRQYAGISEWTDLHCSPEIGDQ